MKIQTIRSEGLAALSYYISSDGDAMIIDPRRDAAIYYRIARAHDEKIRYIFETHRNEDLVTGSLELQSKIPESEIVHSCATHFGFGDHSIDDGETFAVGRMRIACINTPGHTDDSMCYAVSDTSSGPEPIILFTGDTLFVNEVGRTDLVDIKKHSEMSNKLFTSLTEKILPLDDGIIIHPAHGAGSVCGGEISDREFSTLGYEKKHNPWLSMSQDDFIEAKLKQRLTLSPYFKRCENLNTDGPPLLKSFEEIPELELNEFRDLLETSNHQVIDIRPSLVYLENHIPRTISLSLSNMGLLAGWALNSEYSQSFILEQKKDLEMAWSYLVRVGLDNIIGYVDGIFSRWSSEGLEFESISSINPDELKNRISEDSIRIIDVRESYEFETEHISKSQNLPLTTIGSKTEYGISNQPLAVICPSGFRSTTAASILRKAGYNDICVVSNGLKAWKQRGFPLMSGLRL